MKPISYGRLAGTPIEGESMGRGGTRALRGDAGIDSLPSSFASASARWDWLADLDRARPCEPADGGGSGRDSMGLSWAWFEVEAEERRRLPL